MTRFDAARATRRFGLGPRPGDVARIASDPRGYVLSQLQNSAAARLDETDLDPSHVSLMALRLAQRDQRERRKAAAMPEPKAAGAAAPPSMEPPPPPSATPPHATPGQPRPAGIRREVFREEARARLHHAVTTDHPFVERLVMFWSSHFTVSAAKGPAVRVLAGSFEREAIRPHVLGRFADMVRAVVQHPAMLIYLDQAQSIGPASQAGRNRGRGLNENLAREILELHTLGVAGGYTQADVTSLARVLTGWTVAELPMVEAARQRAASGLPARTLEPGRFAFVPIRHEPGPQTVMGRRYVAPGQEQGEAALSDLARHPSTASHIATKLARHFVADQPPPALVERLARALRDTDGDLRVLARTLADADEAWSAPPRKVVPPYDFVVSLVRGFALPPRYPELLRVSAAIGQPLWAPPSPKGWPDDDDAWMAPSAVRERLRIAERAAREIDRKLDPRAAAVDLLGPALSDATRLAIERAEAREQGLELLIMSPEMLRR